jgi:hypothetical protein
MKIAFVSCVNIMYIHVGLKITEFVNENICSHGKVVSVP